MDPAKHEKIAFLIKIQLLEAREIGLLILEPTLTHILIVNIKVKCRTQTNKDHVA